LQLILLVETRASSNWVAVAVVTMVCVF